LAAVAIGQNIEQGRLQNWRTTDLLSCMALLAIHSLGLTAVQTRISDLDLIKAHLNRLPSLMKEGEDAESTKQLEAFQALWVKVLRVTEW
jgi:hypothetical protein